MPQVLDAMFLYSRTSRSPDVVTVLPTQRGLPVVWDATIIHTCAPSHLHAIAVKAGAASAESTSSRRTSSLRDTSFASRSPGETLAFVGPSARASLTTSQCARNLEPDVHWWKRLYGRITVTVQMGNAACVTEACSRKPRQPDHVRKWNFLYTFKFNFLLIINLSYLNDLINNNYFKITNFIK